MKPNESGSHATCIEDQADLQRVRHPTVVETPEAICPHRLNDDVKDVPVADVDASMFGENFAVGLKGNKFQLGVKGGGVEVVVTIIFRLRTSSG